MRMMFFSARGKVYYLVRTFFALLAVFLLDVVSASASASWLFLCQRIQLVVCHQFVDHFVYRFRGYVAAAFKLAVGAFKPRAPFKVFVVKNYLGIVPAAVADVVVYYPIGRGKFIERQGEAADEYDRDAYAVGYPAKAAGQADKKVGMV